MPFFTAAMVFVDQDMLSEMWIPRNLKLWMISTQSPLVMTGLRSVLNFLKSRIIYFVSLVLSDRFFDEHHIVSLLISSLFPSGDEADQCSVICEFYYGVGGMGG